MSWWACCVEGGGGNCGGHLPAAVTLPPPEVGKQAESDSSHGLMHIGCQLVLVQSNCSALFFVCAALGSSHSLAQRSQVFPFDTSICVNLPVYLSAYLQESKMQKEVWQKKQIRYEQWKTA